MLKILQVRLQQYVNRELPDVQAGFRKGRGTRDQIVNIHWIIEKAREFQKNIYFCFIDYAKSFVWITINCGKFWKRWEYQTTWPASWEICMQVRKQQLELDMEPQKERKWSRSVVSRDQIDNIRWIMEKAREFQKNIYFCFIDYAKAFDFVDHKKTMENSSRHGNTRPPFF